MLVGVHFVLGGDCDGLGSYIDSVVAGLVFLAVEGVNGRHELGTYVELGGMLFAAAVIDAMFATGELVELVL